MYALFLINVNVLKMHNIAILVETLFSFIFLAKKKLVKVF